MFEIGELVRLKSYTECDDLCIVMDVDKDDYCRIVGPNIDMRTPAHHLISTGHTINDLLLKYKEYISNGI